ncbi:MAG: HAMP domain-containing sensor histidine kinase [Planctomycetota bacterium]
MRPMTPPGSGRQRRAIAPLTVALLAWCGCGPPRYSLEPLLSDAPVTSFLVGDWDDNGCDEEYRADWCRAQAYVPKGQLEVPCLERLAGLADVDGDNYDELAIARLEPNERAWLCFYDLRVTSFPPDPPPVLEFEDAEYFRYHGLDYREDADWMCSITVSGMDDFNRDGLKDLVLCVITGFELIPRGIWILDGSSVRQRLAGKTLEPRILARAKMDCLPASDGVVIRDLDGDKDPEILLGSVAPDNWTDHTPPAGWPKTRKDDRWRVHLFEFDRTTDELREDQFWEPLQGGHDSYVRAHLGPEIQGEGFYYYLFWHPEGTIQKIDGRSRNVTKARTFSEARALLADFDESGSFDGLVLSYPDGRIELLDENLEEIASGQPRPEVALDPRVIADLDGDGGDELVATSGQSLHVVSLPDLRLMVEQDFYGNVDCVALFRESNETLQLRVMSRMSEPRPRKPSQAQERPDDVRVHRLKLVREFMPAPGAWWFALLGFVFGAGATASIALLVAARRRRLRSNDSPLERQRRQELLDTLRSVGHGKITSSTLSQIAMLVEHLRQVSDSRPDLESRLAELAVAFREVAWPQLARIPPAARAARVSADLAKAYEQALRILKGAFVDAEAIGHEVIVESADRILEAIEGLSRLRREMLAQQAQHFRCDAVAVAEGILRAAAPDAERSGIELAPLEARLKPGVKAFIWETDLRVVLEDLVVNAFRAMQDADERLLSVSVDSSGERIVIDVRDTGVGIPEKLRERIFERGFSTREGAGGFGLYQAAELLDRYGGRIFVAHSQMGAGTTMRVELRPA